MKSLLTMAAAILCTTGLAMAELKPDITVALDGSGDFKTVQEALSSIPRDNKERKVILVKDGVYTERVRVAAPFITLRGQSRKGTRIEFGGGGGNAAPGNAAPGGAAPARGLAARGGGGGGSVMTVNATDLVIENITIINTVGIVGPHEVTISGSVCDRTVIIDSDILSEGADTVALWQNDGRYYHARDSFRGSVDYVCPHGWCYINDCTFYECLNDAGMWHDGHYRPDQKYVLKNCKFDGVEGWWLARHHHDALFFFLDCTFPKTMIDKAPYRVIYPLDGGTPTAADIQNNKDHDPSNIWGERAYYFNNHRTGGDYAWFKDNLDKYEGSPKPQDITAKWTFGGTWDPEDKTGPKISSVDWAEGKLLVKFAESVTVKGKPAAKLAGGAVASYESGSGSDTLVFNAPGKGDAASIDLNDGRIIATIASDSTRDADLTLPRK